MLHAVIMAGGSGTRFWPRSRRQLPKQFLKFSDDRTLIQEAASRTNPLIPAERTWVVTNAAHARETALQLPDIPPSQIVFEPCGRNTAPCIGLAALHLLAVDPEATMLVMPADHVIHPAAMFQQAVQQSLEIVEQDPRTLVLFGVEPSSPSTGFGYIQRGEAVETSLCPAYQVQSFQEKPSQLIAARYMASGEYYWNCGIFVWQARSILQAIQTHAPAVATILNRLREGLNTPHWAELLQTEFPQMPSISIDYAVLEKAEHVCVLEAPFHWDDVGTWQALPRLFPKDREGNTTDGLVCEVDSSDCIVQTGNDHLVALVGVKNLIVVHTPTATLVADKRDEASLKRLIAELERRGLSDYL